jgi:hypothetical protein
MLSDAKNASLIPTWLDHIESEQARDAFVYVVGQAAALVEYQCYAQQKGEVPDFRFLRGNEQPFAFIPNKQWILFYFRAPAVRSGMYKLSSLQQQFDSATENTRGEWTVKLRSISDAKRLWALLSIK